MNKIVVTIIFVFGLTLGVYSQENSPISKQSFDLSGGYESNGYLGRLGYNYNVTLKSKVSLSAQYNYEIFNDDFPDDIAIQLFLINLEYYYNILNINRGNVIISVGLGGVGGYEEIKEEELSNGFEIIGESNSVFGGHAGAEADIYLFETHKHVFSLILNARQYYLTESQLGNYQFNATVGFRYNF